MIRPIRQINDEVENGRVHAAAAEHARATTAKFHRDAYDVFQRGNHYAHNSSGASAGADPGADSCRTGVSFAHKHSNMSGAGLSQQQAASLITRRLHTLSKDKARQDKAKDKDGARTDHDKDDAVLDDINEHLQALQTALQSASLSVNSITDARGVYNTLRRNGWRLDAEQLAGVEADVLETDTALKAALAAEPGSSKMHAIVTSICLVLKAVMLQLGLHGAVANLGPDARRAAARQIAREVRARARGLSTANLEHALRTATSKVIAATTRVHPTATHAPDEEGEDEDEESDEDMEEDEEDDEEDDSLAVRGDAGDADAVTAVHEAIASEHAVREPAVRLVVDAPDAPYAHVHEHAHMRAPELPGSIASDLETDHGAWLTPAAPPRTERTTRTRRAPSHVMASASAAHVSPYRDADRAHTRDSIRALPRDALIALCNANSYHPLSSTATASIATALIRRLGIA